MPDPTAVPTPLSALPSEGPAQSRFEDFDLSDHLLEGVAAAGYQVPTPVQVEAIPPILEGHEVVVQAKTGTGKTAAFGLPLLELIDPDEPHVQAVVLTPTRELAQQVAGELATLGRFGEVRAVAIYGGDSMTRQVRELRAGAHVVIGTPGRVLDHLRRGTLRAGRVEHLVLDEADEMLSMGFSRELNAILSFLPSERRTHLFSATFPPPVERLVSRHVKEPVRISLSSDGLGPEAIEHHYYLAGSREKDAHLVAVLDEERVESALVFCNRRSETRMVAGMLRRHGIHAMPISSDLSQPERDEVMGSLRRGDLTVLVATDIAARGIDISGLSHVINYTVPESPEQYVHRTGRTGRVGRKGTAVTLVGPRELSALKQVERIKGIKIQERRLPPPEVVMETRVERLFEDLKKLASHRSPEERARGDRPEFRAVAERLQSDPGGPDVVYLLLQSFFEGLKRATVREARAGEMGEVLTDELGRTGATPADSRNGTRRRSAPRRSRPR